MHMNKVSPNETLNMMKKYKIATKKNFGQNFLVDQNVIHNIVNTLPLTSNDAVIEIGPGMGALTLSIAAKAGHVYCYEIDHDLKPYLDQLFEGMNVDVRYEDFLTVDINALLKELKSKHQNVYVMANLPYYITTPILFKLLESNEKVDGIATMMQKEVAMRLCAPVGTKEYNALTLIMKYYGSVEIALQVPRSVFIPAPNVDSAVIKMKLQARDDVNQTKLFALLKASFKQRRKTILNNLGEYLQDKKAALVLLEQVGIEPNRRAETIDLETFVQLVHVMEGRYD